MTNKKSFITSNAGYPKSNNKPSSFDWNEFGHSGGWGQTPENIKSVSGKKKKLEVLDYSDLQFLKHQPPPQWESLVRFEYSLYRLSLP